VHISTEMTAALDVERLVDRLRTHPHLPPVAERSGQVIADLLWAPLDAQLGLHPGCQFRILELAGLGPAPAQLGALVRSMWGVLPAPTPRPHVGSVAAQLTADRRGRPVELVRDRPHPDAGQVQVGNAQPFLQAQIAARDDGLLPRHLATGRPAPVTARSSVHPDSITGPPAASSPATSAPRNWPACRSAPSSTTRTTPHSSRGAATTL